MGRNTWEICTFFPFVPDFATIVLSSSQCDTALFSKLHKVTKQYKACKMPGIKYSRNSFTCLFCVKCKSSVAILLALDEKRVTYHSSWVLCHLRPRVRSQWKKPQRHVVRQIIDIRRRVSFCNLVAGVGSAIMDSQVQEGNRQTPQKTPFNPINHDQSWSTRQSEMSKCFFHQPFIHSVQTNWTRKFQASYATKG